MTEKQKEKALSSRVIEAGGRGAAFLQNASLRVLIDDIGGMTPELSCVQENRQINAHYIPWFRANSPAHFNDEEHGGFWRSSLLYNMAGSFPCAPNFGPGMIIDGVKMPPFGWTANLPWKFIKSGTDNVSGGVWNYSEMKAPNPNVALSFKKIDMVIPGHCVHYSALIIKNSGTKDIEINAGFHNTVGAPFLDAGCRISACSKNWTTPPAGGEFDATTRLALGAEFPALSKAPLSYGGKEDLTVVSGPIGHTDFVCGAVPKSSSLSWSAVVNPNLKLAYVCFFTGPAAADPDDIVLYFNDFLMQYGGRPFTPWAAFEGGSDLSYCLGTANAAAAYCYGLEYSRTAKQVLGSPATVNIPALREKTLYYGSLFGIYENNILDGGIVGVDGEENSLVCKSTAESWKFNADCAFKIIRTIRKREITQTNSTPKPAPPPVEILTTPEK
ncbi:MAG: hypothetical protein LBC53_04280 [Spirochaetaceae bacterium]|jgi:hypothetical protein|nr:hypothetical protein [Spirochaetaceae bacterium]